MSMRSTKVQPKSGQYVAVWTFNDRAWSATFRHGEHGLEEYDTQRDIWVRPEPVPSRATSVRYLIAK